MRKNEYKNSNGFLKTLPYVLISIVLAAIVVIITHI